MQLDGAACGEINSRLRPKPERADPVALSVNDGLSFLGSKIYGQGFTLTAKERTELVHRDRKNGERIFPYLGGEEVNTSPTQEFDRYVINFGDMTLEDAGRWPDLLNIVREKVKPERHNLRNNPDGRRLKEIWWQFGRYSPALNAALRGLSRCLVTARVTKHLCFSWQPTDRVLNEKLYVFPFEDNARFACLQSRIHEPWTRLLSSTLEERLNYSASDCFATFPFPHADRLTATSSLEAAGAKLDAARAKYMRETNQGLTQTYNHIKDPEYHDLPMQHLRQLHEDLDRTTLAAYGWSDIAVPQYQTPTTPTEKRALEVFEDEVIDRLFALNEQRATEEALGIAEARQIQPRKRVTAQKSRPPTKDTRRKTPPLLIPTSQSARPSAPPQAEIRTAQPIAAKPTIKTPSAGPKTTRRDSAPPKQKGRRAKQTKSSTPRSARR